MSNYELIRDHVGKDVDAKKVTEFSTSPHWVVCVVRLGIPLSYSRAEGKSITNDYSQGARLRGDNLIIASDCVQLNTLTQAILAA